MAEELPDLGWWHEACRCANGEATPPFGAHHDPRLVALSKPPHATKKCRSVVGLAGPGRGEPPSPQSHRHHRRRHHHLHRVILPQAPPHASV